MAGRLMKVGKAFYLFTIPGNLFPDSSVLTNSAWSYLHHADFLMNLSVFVWTGNPRINNQFTILQCWNFMQEVPVSHKASARKEV